MAGTKNHDLSDLVGKKIKSITLQEIDVAGGFDPVSGMGGEDVRQFYHITCADGDKLVLACEGSSVTLMDSDDFADFLEQLECEEDSVLDDDSEVEDSADDEDNLFDSGDEDYEEEDDD